MDHGKDAAGFVTISATPPNRRGRLPGSSSEHSIRGAVEARSMTRIGEMHPKASHQAYL